MVCLKADASRLDELVRANGHRMADFVDEDLGDTRTAVAVGPLERDVGERLFGDLGLA
jgi:hypothetical protein